MSRSRGAGGANFGVDRHLTGCVQEDGNMERTAGRRSWAVLIVALCMLAAAGCGGADDVADTGPAASEVLGPARITLNPAAPNAGQTFRLSVQACGTYTYGVRAMLERRQDGGGWAPTHALLLAEDADDTACTHYGDPDWFVHDAGCTDDRGGSLPCRQIWLPAPTESR